MLASYLEVAAEENDEGARSLARKLLAEIQFHQAADQSYMDEGVRLLELAQGAHRNFVRREPREKRRLLNFVLSNSVWKSGELTSSFRQPFDLLAETTAIAAKHAAAGDALSTQRTVWLPGPDSNQRPSG